MNQLATITAAHDRLIHTHVERENKIRERAYWIWLGEGLPDGREHDHWRPAESEVDADDAPKTA
jgi:hypothetical protein